MNDDFDVEEIVEKFAEDMDEDWDSAKTKSLGFVRCANGKLAEDI